MADVMVNIASGLWIVIGVVTICGLRKWNKRFQELYDELMGDMTNG